MKEGYGAYGEVITPGERREKPEVDDGSQRERREQPDLGIITPEKDPADPKEENPFLIPFRERLRRKSNQDKPGDAPKSKKQWN